MTKPALNSELVDTFWSLAEGKDEKRVSAAISMIGVLRRSQGAGDVLSADLEYTLQRLVRGLASERKWARLGFAMALTQVLKEFRVVTTGHLICQIKEKLKTDTNDNSGETSNIIIGRVMAVLCIAESGALAKADKGETGLLLKWLLTARKLKQPLNHLCVAGIVQLISKVSNKCFEEELFPLLKDELSVGWEKCSPDSLLLLLRSRRHHPAVIDKLFLKNHWKCTKLLSDATWSHIGAVIHKSCQNHPIVHGVCHELLQQVSEDPEIFTKFWTKVIQDIVFPAPGPKKYLCYQLVPLFLKSTHTADQVSMIVSDALVGSVVKNLKVVDFLLHPAAKALVEELVKFVAECTEGDKQVAVLKALVSTPSSTKFDLLSKTNTIVRMETSLVSEGVQQWCRVLKGVVRGDSSSGLVPEEDEALSEVRNWAATRLANLVTISSMVKGDEKQLGILKFLFTHSYFNVTHKFEIEGQKLSKLKTPLDETNRNTLRLSFFKAVQKLAAHSTGKTAVHIDQLFGLTIFIDKLLKQKKHIFIVNEMDMEVHVGWNTIIDRLENIRAKDQDDKHPTQTEDSSGFQLLLMHLALQIFSEPDQAIELLNDVVVCYENSLMEKSDADWVAVLTEILVSMLAKPSAMVRTTVNLVFNKMCSHMNLPALQVILDVLMRQKQEDGILDAEDSESEEEMQEDDSGANESSELNETEEESEEDESEEEASEEDSDDENINDSRVQELRAKLRSELGDAALPSDDSDDENKELEDFDDETMLKLDSKIAAAFKLMSKTKKATKEAALEFVHFKIRCLDLLETYIKSGPQAAMSVQLLPPILSIMEITFKSSSPGYKELGQRALKVFEMLCKTKKFSDDGQNLNTESLLETFDSLIQSNTKVSRAPLAKHIASACLLVMKVSLANDQGSSQEVNPKIVASLRSSLKEFCTRRDSKFNPAFFDQICCRQPLFVWGLTSDMLTYACDKNIRIFCRSQVCSLLGALINKATVRDIGPTKWASFMTELTEKLPKVLEELVERKDYKARFVQDFLLVLHRVFSNDRSKKEEFASLLGDNLKALVPKVKPPNVASVRRIMKMLGVPDNTQVVNKKQKKRTLSHGEDDSNDGSKKNAEVRKKKKKKSKEANGNQIEENGMIEEGNEVEMEDVESSESKPKPNKKQKVKQKKSKESQ